MRVVRESCAILAVFAGAALLVAGAVVLWRWASIDPPELAAQKAAEDEREHRQAVEMTRARLGCAP